MSGNEHAPGPRGSPQEPQAPIDGAEDDIPFAETAKTENFGVRLLLWHFGQEAFSLPKTRASNSWSQLLHTYSKIGIGELQVVAVIQYKSLRHIFTAETGFNSTPLSARFK